jgi:hypothetical protein
MDSEAREDLVATLDAMRMLLAKLLAEQLSRLESETGAARADLVEGLLASGERGLGRLYGALPEPKRSLMIEKTRTQYAALIDTVALARTKGEE